jgi:hypothetical protein
LRMTISAQPRCLLPNIERTFANERATAPGHRHAVDGTAPDWRAPAMNETRRPRTNAEARLFRSLRATAVI